MSPSFLLVQVTLLLALAWIAHALVRHAHPRARLLLWRSVLVIALLQPLARVLPLPRLSLVVPAGTEVLLPTAPAPPPLAAVPLASPKAVESTPDFAPATRSTSTALGTVELDASSSVAVPRFGFFWPHLLTLLWLAGFAWETLRLALVHEDLRRVVRRARPAPASILARANVAGAALGMRGQMRILVSDAIDSPCLCGIAAPVILLPPSLVADDLPPAELDALLAHELAHQRRHDLPWCLAWRAMRAVLWFHPLAWPIPDAHALACEEEADRLAASRPSTGDAYPQLLARLALRLLPPAPAHRALALHASSHLARRLAQLARSPRAGWSTRHTLAGLAGVAALAVLAAGWQFTHRVDAPASGSTPTLTALTTISVRDVEGRPVVGATITPSEVRADNRMGLLNHAAWRDAVLGSPTTLQTDAEGRARLAYPLHIDSAQKFITREVVFSVQHPDFGSTEAITQPVDRPAGPVWLEPGLPLRIRPYAGPSRTPVTEIEPLLLGDNRVLPRARWKAEDDGSFTWWTISPGKYFLLVAGRLPSGEIGYSEPLAFFGAQRDKHDYPLELKPGIRIEGRLDERVARPVKNGWVQLSVHSGEANTARSGSSSRLRDAANSPAIWQSHRPVAPDGTFVFESVPPGEFRFIAHGDGFISASGLSDAGGAPAARGAAQSFSPVAPLTAVTLATEPAAALRVTVTAGGSPVAGAEISVSPYLASGGGIFGRTRPSSEAPFRRLATPSEPVYRATTDRRGVAMLPNLPAFTEAVAIRHERFEAPERRIGVGVTGVRRTRDVAIRLTPGGTTQANVAVQPR